MRPFVYKIGERYLNRKDYNSGLHEYNLIIDAVANLDFKNSMLIIINGLLDDDNVEKTHLMYLMQEYDKRIFIASDIIAFENNLDIINECDYVLHQYGSDKDLPDNYFYSWVPELFYVDRLSSDILTRHDNKNLFFGGGVRGMQDLLLEYSNIPHDFILKTDTQDNRLSYTNYMKKQQQHRYTLIICREKYAQRGWVTSRFVEAISNNSIPIVDKCYDKYEHFVSNEYRVNNHIDAWHKMLQLDADIVTRAFVLEHFKGKLRATKNNFVELIKILGRIG